MSDDFDGIFLARPETAPPGIPLAWGQFGVAYAVAAAALGAWLLWLAFALRRDPTRRRAALLFHYSLLYLALLFVAVALDPLLG